MLFTFYTVSRKYIFGFMLFINLFTLIAYPQIANAVIIPVSLNWVGYQALEGRGTFTAIEMIFTVPAITAAPGTSLAANNISPQVGLGGGGNTSPQEEVNAGVNSAFDSQGKQENTAWWEVYGTDPSGKTVVQQNLKLAKPINPHDQIRVIVSSNMNNDGYDAFSIEDLTQKTRASHMEKEPAAFSDSASAQCIAERPNLDDSLGPLPLFSPIHITSCLVGTKGNKTLAPIGNFNPIRIPMVNSSGSNKIVANPSPLQNKTRFDIVLGPS